MTDSWLGRRNPSVKLLLLVGVSSVLLFVLDPVTPALLYAVAVPAVLLGTRIRPGALAVAHLPFATFALGLLVVNLVSRPAGEGLSIGLALALRTLLVGVLSVGFLVSTDPVELMTSLRQNARLGVRVTYALVAGHRMLQDLPREWETIRQAQAVRSDLGRGGALPRTPAALGRAAFGLLVASLRRGERVAQTLESRGLGLRPRTTWRPVPVRPADGLLATVVTATVVAVLLTSWWLGRLQGVGVLTGG